MKNLRLPTRLIASGLLTCLSLVVLCPQKAAAQAELALGGATYITTVTDSTGAFASREVITLNLDRTLLVIDSGQGGPANHFSSQQGVWGISAGKLVGRALDFDFAPNSDVARLDYTFTFGAGGSISGTVTLRIFPLTADPLAGGGTLIGTFTFKGTKVTLP